jgi:hypothetical protein
MWSVPERRLYRLEASRIARQSHDEISTRARDRRRRLHWLSSRRGPSETAWSGRSRRACHRSCRDWDCPFQGLGGCGEHLGGESGCDTTVRGPAFWPISMASGTLPTVARALGCSRPSSGTRSACDDGLCTRKTRDDFSGGVCPSCLWTRSQPLRPQQHLRLAHIAGRESGSSCGRR